MNPFREDPNAEKVAIQQYECFYDLVDAKGQILFGSKPALIRMDDVSGVSLTKGQSVTEKLEEILQMRVGSWAAGIRVPGYLTASGEIGPRAERVLTVEVGNRATTQASRQ
jgi:hypothetical protein